MTKTDQQLAALARELEILRAEVNSLRQDRGLPPLSAVELAQPVAVNGSFRDRMDKAVAQREHLDGLAGKREENQDAAEQISVQR